MINKKESKKITGIFPHYQVLIHLDSCVFPSSVNVGALSLVWFRRPIINTKVGHRCLGSPRSLRPQTRLTAWSMETFLIFSTSKIIYSFHSSLQAHECSLQASKPPCDMLEVMMRSVIVKQNLIGQGRWWNVLNN
jgi:hypothetical protein